MVLELEQLKEDIESLGDLIRKDFKHITAGIKQLENIEDDDDEWH